MLQEPTITWCIPSVIFVLMLVIVSCTESAPSSTPQAQADSVTVEQGKSILIDVLANDEGLNDVPIKLELENEPKRAVTSVVNNQISYALGNDYLGQDRFDYRVTDNDGDTSEASVAITIKCPTATCQRTFKASWQAVNHPELIEYCIHRGTEPDVFIAADTVCVDKEKTSHEWTLTVTAGQDYFAITAKTIAGESDYSAAVVLESY